MSQEENNELGKLIDINEDACEFYGSAQEKADSPEIKRTFSELESLHRTVATNLKSRVRANGGDAEAGGTFAGQTRKFWGELMASISNDVDETLVTHLEEAEDRCLHSIQEAMEDPDISPQTKTTLRQELQTLQKSHDYMKALKDALKAA